MSLFISIIVDDRFNPVFIQLLSKFVSCFAIDSGSKSQFLDVIQSYSRLSGPTCYVSLYFVSLTL